MRRCTWPGLAHAPDHQVFAKAASEGWVVVASDLDFGEILAHSSGHVSTVIFRSTARTSEDLLRRLDLILANAGSALGAGAVVIVERGRFRVRLLPLGTG